MSPTSEIEAMTDAPGIEIVRTFDAPRRLVYDVWTKQNHLAHWSAPHGFTIPEGRGDVRPGGEWFCCMRGPDGTSHRAGGVYRDVVPNERLVMTHAWQDENGRPGHATLVTVTFEDVADGGTEVVFRQDGFDSDASRHGHGEGWNECFKKLTEYLAELQMSV